MGRVARLWPVAGGRAQDDIECEYSIGKLGP